MKKLFIGLLIVSAGVSAKAQGVDAPAAVKNSFEMILSSIKNPRWEKQEIVIYKANYTDNGVEYVADFTADGRWLKTYNQIKEIDLPANIMNQLITTYKSFKILRVGIELNAEGKFYLLNLENGKEKMDMYFTMSGKLVK